MMTKALAVPLLLIAPTLNDLMCTLFICIDPNKINLLIWSHQSSISSIYRILTFEKMQDTSIVRNGTRSSQLLTVIIFCRARNFLNSQWDHFYEQLFILNKHLWLFLNKFQWISALHIQRKCISYMWSLLVFQKSMASLWRSVAPARALLYNLALQISPGSAITSKFISGKYSMKSATNVCQTVNGSFMFEVIFQPWKSASNKHTLPDIGSGSWGKSYSHPSSTVFLVNISLKALMVWFRINMSSCFTLLSSWSFVSAMKALTLQPKFWPVKLMLPNNLCPTLFFLPFYSSSSQKWTLCYLLFLSCSRSCGKFSPDITSSLCVPRRIDSSE